MDKTRPDDSALIDDAEAAPAFGGSSGGNLQREIGAQAEEEHELDQAGEEGNTVTRVRASHKPDDGDKSNLANRD
jgi:hypothetical protein